MTESQQTVSEGYKLEITGFEESCDEQRRDLTHRDGCRDRCGVAAVACTVGAPGAPAPGPSADDAKKFLDGANDTLLKLSVAGSQAGWVAQNFITDDTEALDARGTQQLADAGAKFAKESTRFDKMQLPADQRRQLDVLKVSLVLATPADAKEAEEVTQLNSRMRAAYGKGKWCPDPAKPDQCHNIDEVTKVLASSRNDKELRREWEGWQTISPPMKKDYARFAELSNKGAKELGFADTGAMWRATIRHAARRLCEGARSAVGSGTSALSRSARVRAHEAS